jgi:hypothetical protein
VPPVSFEYKGDKTGTTQYGLVAEEVEKVYPELVVHGADGKVLTVRYTMLTSMLLNELQKEKRQIASLSKHLAEARVSQHAQAAQLQALQSSIAQRLAVLERTMAARRTTDSLASAKR